MRHYKNEFGHWFRALGIASACMFLPVSQAFALPVIPGAVGYGIDTPAGRGGSVYRVTNLNASGSGSLKACLDASGPRVCVFEVSGTIRLTSDIQINNPNLTVAGQTAPSPGITIRGAGLKVSANDVLIQHIRMRVGDDRDGSTPSQRAGFKIMHGSRTVNNVVLDHVSVSWTIDQLLSVWDGARNVTVNNSVFAEPLDDSLHPSAPHGFGPLVAGQSNTRMSMIGNVISTSRARNPRTAIATFLFANNVVYNWKTRGTEIFNRNGVPSKTSLIGNVYKPGPESGSTKGIVIEPNRGNASLAMHSNSRVYVSDNRGAGYNASNPWSMVDNYAGNWVRATSSPVSLAGFEPMDSSKVEAHVLANAGARPTDRDSVDKRIMSQVANGTGRMIDSPRDVGGWPSTPVNRRVLALPSNPNADSNGNGYTNLEEWLHAFAAEMEGVKAEDPKQPARPKAPANLTAD
ncbi:MAG: hypothetical protein WED00_11965 [Aquisalimonadaceae bacterium]